MYVILSISIIFLSTATLIPMIVVEGFAQEDQHNQLNISNFQLINSDTEPKFTADIENPHDYSVPYVFYVEIVELGSLAWNSWISGVLEPGQTISRTLPNTSTVSGTTSAHAIVYDNLASGITLAEQSRVFDFGNIIVDTPLTPHFTISQSTLQLSVGYPMTVTAVSNEKLELPKLEIWDSDEKLVHFFYLDYQGTNETGLHEWITIFSAVGPYGSSPGSYKLHAISEERSVGSNVLSYTVVDDGSRPPSHEEETEPEPIQPTVSLGLRGGGPNGLSTINWDDPQFQLVATVTPYLPNLPVTFNIFYESSIIFNLTSSIPVLTSTVESVYEVPVSPSLLDSGSGQYEAIAIWNGKNDTARINFVSQSETPPDDIDTTPSTAHHDVNILDGTNDPLSSCAATDSCFSPSSLNVNVGDTVTWTNDDATPQTITSGSPNLGPDEIFDSDVVYPTMSFSHVFDQIGVYQYFSVISPWANGEITVIAQDIPTSNSGTHIPEWIKNNAGWWAEGIIEDDEYIQGLEYLIRQNILEIPPTEVSAPNNRIIPEWIKNNAERWADGLITDDEYIRGLQFLISNGIISIGNETGDPNGNSGSEEIETPVFIDSDNDGFLDENDQCINQPETINGFEDGDGCPDDNSIDSDNDGVLDWQELEADIDNDGISDSTDNCPQQPESFNGNQDEDGCPDEILDSDNDGIPNNQDICLDEPETLNNFMDRDGCPDETVGLVATKSSNDLSISTQIGSMPDSIFPGNKLQLLIDVKMKEDQTESFPVYLDDAWLSVNLPLGMKFNQELSDDDCVDSGNNIINCQMGEMYDGENYVKAVSFEILNNADSGSYSITAEVGHPTDEPTPNNNISEVVLEISQKQTTVSFQNDTIYPIISLMVDGQELIPFEMGILPGYFYSLEIPSGSHSFSSIVGWWQDGERHSLYPHFQGSFNQIEGIPQIVIIPDVTVNQILTQFGDRSSWDAMIFDDQALPHIACFTFYSNGNYEFKLDGVLKNSGTLSQTDRNKYSTKFSTGQGVGTMWETSGWFGMYNNPYVQNGAVQYTYQSGLACVS